MALNGSEHQRAITFGVQNVTVGEDEVKAAFTKMGKTFIRTAGEPLCTAIFKSLRCERLESLDVYSDEGPTHVIDLNERISTNHINSFDLVYDGGTLEHCFNVPEVLRNTVRLLKVGGRVIHHTPMNNWTDHGFYQISPTLFFDFYSAAGFENFKLRLHFINGQEERQIEHRWPDDPLPYGIGRGVRILCHFTAIKAKEVNIDKLTTLVQRRYRQHFGGEIDSLHTDARQQSRWNKLQNSIKKRTFFLRAAKL